MSDDAIAEIDEMLSDKLPDDPGEVSEEVGAKRKREMLQLLRRVADELGKSPTIREFRSLDTETSASAIKRAFGSWNDAKREAGLKTRQRGTVVSIDEEYFESVDSAEKAYWLGTLVARSSLQPQAEGSNYQLRLGRTARKGYFVRGFADAVESEYPINEYSRSDDGQRQVQCQISNPTFVSNLISAGYPAPDEDTGDFPTIGSELRPPFVRGYLESSGYFSVNGWQIKTDSEDRGERLREWFEEFGAKRPTLGERDGDGSIVRVSNAFDIKAVYETCWPEQIDTDPSFAPYARKILEHLESEYPYPENLPYLSD